MEASEFYKTMKLFNGVFGVGSCTARKWFNLGYRSLDDLITNNAVLKKDQKIGKFSSH